MDSFITIRFKRETAKRFQEFSKIHFKSHTDAMATMLDFFFYNEISPKEKFGPTGRTLEANLKKRINAIIAIIKAIEKGQTLPTVATLSALFEQTEPAEKKLILEKNRSEEIGQMRYREKDSIINNTQK
ncbi:BfmA/BtgA family mobilization protein [Gelidibacter salicanalis]|uniref:Golgi family protein P55 n=1 Tax=Gelidibacter salicanalis TaxID=291193 RepID=A0A934NKQ7_9FLAO|nr:BfmA/BtgA family mobilization protein [Gelidibacter salicanalis]MBJ7881852.1 hypothetical protein [Gelidibacter salicanalis]